MKLSFAAVCAALSLSFAGATFAADATDTASGASDSTVMTQSQDAKAVQKHKNESKKGGRPLNTTVKKSAN